MADANPYHTPLLAGADTHLVKYDLQASALDIKHYQSLIGSLLYIQIGTAQTFPLLYHIWHSMQQTPHLIIYASRNMSSPILWALRMCACAMMAPMEKASLAIRIPVWQTRLTTVTPPPVIYSY
jgi:hypothetical protein